MKNKPIVINSFEQLDDMIGKTLYENAYAKIAVERPFNKMNFTEFQVQLRCCLIIKDGFDNDWMQDFYSDFIEDYKAGYYDTVKEWAEIFFQEVTLDTHSYCLVTKLSPTVKQEPTGAINKPVTEIKRVSLLAKSKRRY